MSRFSNKIPKIFNSKRCCRLVARYVNHFAPYFSTPTSLILDSFSIPEKLKRIWFLALLWKQFACRTCQPILDPSARYSSNVLSRQIGVVNIFMSPNYQSKGFLSCLSLTALQELEALLWESDLSTKDLIIDTNISTQ